ncbi:hypothetical protein [Actinocrispum wychmicini]|uniref:Uncharacterized protein n=1 Tax=Actinocrispum wychmicini TaxID=1213861 RepID=A0A4R2JWB3_9PSEU|nr:hypothetical protein [Actinocrispum wychmicini]TCO64743.1 hypothetical protein EV192_101525 [Actinocrispum wychmicini]
MDELERRLRSALTDMAGEVPPSHNAWAEQERRLALKSRRTRLRPALLAAVAAAVVALVAIPVIILNSRSSAPVDHAAIPTATPPESSESSASPPVKTFPQVNGYSYQSIPGETLLTPPTWLDNLQQGRSIVGYVVNRESLGGPAWCYAVVTQGGPVNGPNQQGAATCQPIKPAGKSLFWSQTQIPDTDTPGVFVFVTGPQVDNILVRRGEGDGYRQAYTFGRTQDFAVLMVQMASDRLPKAYTARDKDNKPLESK